MLGGTASEGGKKPITSQGLLQTLRAATWDHDFESTYRRCCQTRVVAKSQTWAASVIALLTFTFMKQLLSAQRQQQHSYEPT
eukprot:scaffold131769_cov17-Prasinocladus_malaysianus.AAC.2